MNHTSTATDASRAGTALLAAAALLLIGSVLPWYSARVGDFSVSRNGIGDGLLGWICLAAGIVAAILGVQIRQGRPASRGLWRAARILSVASLVAVAIRLADVSRTVETELGAFKPSIEIGLMLSGLGAIVAVIGAYVLAGKALKRDPAIEPRVESDGEPLG